MALPAPNYTQFPNVLIAQLPTMPDSAVRIAIAVARRTFGWHKRKDKISLSQLEQDTGLTRQGCIGGANWLILHGYMAKEFEDIKKPYMGCTYELLVNDVDQSMPLTTYRPNKRKGSQPASLPLVNDVDTQKKLSNKLQPQRKKKIAADAATIPNPATSTPAQEGTPEPGNSSPLQQSPIEDDVPAAPAPPVVKGKLVKPAPGPRQPDPVFDKLCAMTDSVPAMHGGLIGSTRKKINLDAQHPCTVPNLERFELWWCSTWMSKNDAKPTLGQISQRWGQAQAWANKHAPKPAPLAEQLSPADEAELEAQLLAEMQARENEITARRQASGWVKTQTV